jgi:protease I
MDRKNSNSKKIIILIAQNNFCDAEYIQARSIFESYRMKCKVASSDLSTARGMEGTAVDPDILISKIILKDYDALCLIGGVGCTEYWHDKSVHSIVVEANKRGLLLCAICLAPVILANAGLLKGIRATAYPSAASYIQRKGANYSPRSVEIEKNIITANGPEAADLFAQKVCDKLIHKITAI